MSSSCLQRCISLMLWLYLRAEDRLLLVHKVVVVVEIDFVRLNTFLYPKQPTPDHYIQPLGSAFGSVCRLSKQTQNVLWNFLFTNSAFHHLHTQQSLIIFSTCTSYTSRLTVQSQQYHRPHAPRCSITPSNQIHAALVQQRCSH